jgi:hypothetical protein
MKRILCLLGIAVLWGVSLPGNASVPDAKAMASALAADYQILSESAAAFDFECGGIIIEARLPIDAKGDETLEAILDHLPAGAEPVIVTDRCAGVRWLHVRCAASRESVYETALELLTALKPLSLNTVQLALNARFETGAVFTGSEKEDVIDTIFTSIGARELAAMADERMASASGYSPRLSSCVGEGADAMNITASLYADRTGEGSVLWLGTPVLTVEY